MLIDWFTVSAQVLNFLILVWLLRRFLYQPILKAIDAREKRIADELADAATKQSEANREREEYGRKNAEFEQQRATLLSKATKEANEEQQRLLGEARDAADALSAKRQDALRDDTRNLNQALTRRVQDEVFAIARKVLTDLAGIDLEERVCTAFISQLRVMDNEVKSRFAASLQSSPEPALIRSAFDLSATQRAELKSAIDETFAAGISLHFEISPDLVTGIELTANGNKVAWSIADSLTLLEKGVAKLRQERARIETKPEAKPVAKTEPQRAVAIS